MEGFPIWAAPITASSSPGNTDESVMARICELDSVFNNQGGMSFHRVNYSIA